MSAPAGAPGRTAAGRAGEPGRAGGRRARGAGPGALVPSLVVAGVAVLWGTNGLVVRAVDLPAATVVAARVGVAAVALSVVLALWRPTMPRGTPPPTRAVRWAPWISGTLLAAHWTALFAALQRAPIGTVLLITYLAPVGIALAAALVLGERAGWRTFVALGVAAAGTAVLVAPTLADGSSAPGGGSTVAGLVLAGLASASYVVLVVASKSLTARVHPVRLARDQFAAAALVLVPVVALSGGWTPPAWSWWWLVLLGAVHTAAAVVAYYWALARLPAARVAVLSYLEPAAAVAFGAAFLGEAVGAATILGGVLILVAGVLVVRDGARERAEAVPPGEPVAVVTSPA